MTVGREWFWQLAAEGRGPDWFFYVSVAPAEAARLAAVIRALPRPDFAYHAVEHAWCERHQHQADYDLYVDAPHAEAVLANLGAGPQTNVWVYQAVTVCGSDITFERGYGGRPEEAGGFEAAAVQALLDLPLTEWRIVAGGQGYDPVTAGAGADAASLRAYLQAPPAFQVTRAHLKQALDQQAWDLLDKLLEHDRSHIDDNALYTDTWGLWCGLLLQAVQQGWVEGVTILLKHGARRDLGSWGDGETQTPVEAAQAHPVIRAFLEAPGRPAYTRQSDPAWPAALSPEARQINQQGAIRDQAGLVFPVDDSESK